MKRILVVLAAGVMMATVGRVQAAPVVREAAGVNAAAIAPAIALFRNDLGGVNNGVSTNGGATFKSGRREINWDAPALPGDMPGDFFNATSLRGLSITTPGSGLMVSSNSATAPERLFGDINPNYVTQFTTNSPNRIFAAAGSPEVWVSFTVPAAPRVSADVRGFGVVFTDVEEPFTSGIRLYGANEQFLGEYWAPVSVNGGLSFLGVSFDDGERITMLRVTGGNVALGPNADDGQVPLGRTPLNDLQLDDIVAMDDFIYGEPQPSPFAITATGNVADQIGYAIDTFRQVVGGLNNGVSTNGGEVATTGRREINWDAGALPGNMPADFFNNNSKRGVVFSTPGTGFLVSSNSATAPERLFADLNPNYDGQFTTNSPNRLFTPVGSTIVDATFFVPAQPTVPATIGAFGAVFTDVEHQGPSRLEFYDLEDDLIATLIAPAYDGNAGLTFAGLTLPEGVRAARVRIISGTAPLGPVTTDDEGTDVVALDDFLFSEPLEVVTTSTTSTTSSSSTSTSSSTSSTTSSSTSSTSTSTTSSSTSSTTSSSTSSTTSSTTSTTTSSTSSTTTTSTTSSSTTTAVSLQAALDATNLTWTTGGYSPWSTKTLTTVDGVDAARSGQLEPNQESWIETTVTGPGVLHAWWKLTAADGDILELLVDGSNAFPAISGLVDWQEKAYSVGPGTHTYRWRHEKIAFTSVEGEGAWLDQLSWTPADGYRTEQTWDQGAVTWADGWCHLNWFDYYVDTDFVPAGWIWHDHLGHIYIDPSSLPDSIWLQANTPGVWLWTSKNSYPYLYVPQRDLWIWYQRGTHNPNWFLNTRNGQWYSR